MEEITGDLWRYYGMRNYVVCITTNCNVKIGGRAVMGKGVALQARQRIPNIDKELGYWIQHRGSELRFLDGGRVLAFPTKYNWWDKSDLELIRYSASNLSAIANDPAHAGTIYILPRPGCANGGLKWEDVKPVISHLPDNVRIITSDETKDQTAS